MRTSLAILLLATMFAGCSSKIEESKPYVADPVWQQQEARRAVDRLDRDTR